MNRTSSLMRGAYALAGLNDPSMGDERERDVVLRAYAFALVLAMVLGFGTAIVFAVLGLGLWSLVPVIVVGIPSWAAIWFAGNEGVDLVTLMNRSGKTRLRVTWAATFGFLLIWGSALAFHMLTARPLIQIPMNRDIVPSGAGPVIAGIIGAGVGLLAAVLALKARSRRTQRRVAAESED